jgi:prevent-host-death family protein
MEATRISARELSRNTAEVLDRVAAGETIEVTRNGVAIAVLTPPDPTEVLAQGLIKAGILEPDWRKRQTEALRALRPLPADGRSGSDALIGLREEETR